MTQDAHRFHPDSKIIDEIGTTSFVAAECEVRSQAVSKWRRTGIPRGHRNFLRVKYPEAFLKASQVATQEAA